MAQARDDDSDDAAVRRKVRTIFLSDVHLGARGAQVDVLLEFLKHHQADTIYLVGDIIDGWKLKSSWFWPQSHNDLVQKLLRKVRKGTRVVYIPGNHDEFLRPFAGMVFGGVEIRDFVVHLAADGRRYLVLHGDEFDVVVRNARWLALLGDWAYDAAIWLNARIGRARRRLGYPYWSLSNWAKQRVKNAVSFIGDFEATLAAEAGRREVDGIICGHIHCAAIRDIGGVRYLNTGDWVESCTALVERHDGHIEIVNWAAQSEALNAGGRLRGGTYPKPRLRRVA